MTKNPPSDVSRRSRKAGYLVAVVVNAILLVLVNARPGWRVLPFLTQDFVGVLWLVNLSLVASAGVNLAYMRYDAAWFRSTCQVACPRWDWRQHYACCRSSRSTTRRMRSTGRR